MRVHTARLCVLVVVSVVFSVLRLNATCNFHEGRSENDFSHHLTLPFLLAPFNNRQSNTTVQSPSTTNRAMSILGVSVLFMNVILTLSTSLVVHGFSHPTNRRTRSTATASTLNAFSTLDRIKDIITINGNYSKRSDEKYDIANQLMSTCTNFGQVGSKLTEEEQSTIDDIVSKLTPYSDSSPAKIELKGNHNLVYSASPGGSSGAIGPFVGKVTQSFPNETQFINRVEFLNGIVKIELNAERKVLDDNRIKVVFKETAVKVFGKEVVRKEVKGQGVWSYVFGGIVSLKNGNGEEEEYLLRVLKTPSTFVIVQKQ